MPFNKQTHYYFYFRCRGHCLLPWESAGFACLRRFNCPLCCSNRWNNFLLKSAALSR